MARVIANRYEIEDEIGRGGMAMVFRARDLRLHRFVALKLMHPFLATQAESSARFLREAEAIAKLHHPNIVEIFDTGQDEETGSQFLVMELVSGPTLRDFIKQHPIKIPEVGIAMACSLCDAIAHAHSANIIHRDIKPENIMIAPDGTLKLMDFGIARILDNERMTASGAIIGSPAHMSPEIIEGQRYSYPCDIFSLGTVLYYALTTELPFKGATPMAVFKAILDGNYPPPSRHNLSVPRKIDRIVDKCLRTKPEERYQTAVELKAELTGILKDSIFESYKDVLKAYCANPDAFNDEKLPLIKSRLLSTTKQALKTRRIPVAIESLNTLLAYDPNDQEAIHLIQNIRNGSIFRHRILKCALLLFVLCIVFGSLYYFSTSSVPIIETTSTPQEQPDAAVSKRLPDNIIQNVIYHSVAENLIDPTYINQRDLFWNGEYAIENTLDRHKTGAEQIHDSGEIPDNTQTPSSDQPTPDSAPNLDLETPSSKQQISHKSAETQKAHTSRVKPPKKMRETTQTVSQNTESETSNNSTASDAANVTQKQLIHITQPVFPFDAYAFINGKQYDADSSGNIEFDLAPGTYKMTLTCKTRCISKKTSLLVSAGSSSVTKDVVTLDWADATLTVNASSDDIYFVAIRLDVKTAQVSHLLPNIQTPFSGFNAFGNKPIRLDVYAIPKSRQLKGYDRQTLEKEKMASTRVELLPGDNRTITF